jgi:hypothetical protein
MKNISPRNFLIFLLLIALLGVCSFQSQIPISQQVGNASPTPTIDPLVEPLLPSNPTELEFGQNRYWHWCMTCHGDRGQGLTDEFRGVWEPEHQNCWARGCHTGRTGDLGFPIPTVVPAIVDDARLSRFSSLQEFADFLKATHPPQSPGVLTDKEYHAIALFVFTMNGRAIESVVSTAALVSTPTKPIPVLTEITSPSNVSKNSSNSVVIGGFAVLAVLVVIVLSRGSRVQEKDISETQD